MAVDMPLRFLIADDLGAHQRLMSNIVGFLGGEMRFASDGREVIRLAQSEEFDVLLLDLQMPELGGVAAADRLMHHWREHPRRPRLIAVTADNTPERRALCRAIGMDGFIAKPYDAPALRDALQQVVIRGHCWNDGPPRRTFDMKRFLAATRSTDFAAWSREAPALLRSTINNAQKSQELREALGNLGFLSAEKCMVENNTAEIGNELHGCIVAGFEALCTERDEVMAVA